VPWRFHEGQTVSPFSSDYKPQIKTEDLKAKRKPPPQPNPFDSGCPQERMNASVHHALPTERERLPKRPSKM
jgi:hypothetical protein